MLKKELLFALLMIVFSPFIIILTVIMTILTLLFMPFDYLVYKKYSTISKYTLFFSIKNRKIIKELKKTQASSI